MPPRIIDHKNEEMILRGKCATIIRLLRERNSQTQDDLAEVLGVNRQYVGDVETGRRTIPTHIVYRLSKHFNVPMELMLGGKMGAKNQ